MLQLIPVIIEKIDAENFFRGLFETALKKGEIIESIEFEIPLKSNYQKLPNPASRYAVVGVYVAKYKSGINVGVTGAKSCVYNDKDLANELSKNFSSSAIDKSKNSFFWYEFRYSCFSKLQSKYG